MTMRPVFALAALLGLVPAARGQDPQPTPEPTPAAPPPAAVAPPARIQWYATWAQGKAEAARLRRPILLLSAAPQCHGISGLW